MTSTPALKLTNISKHFGGVDALSGIDLELNSGEITALVGDNGAGKSTLTKIISGIHVPDSGQIESGGDIISFRGPRDAADAGIQTVYQDLALCDNLNTVQNLFLGREVVGGRPFPLLIWEEMEQIATQTLTDLGVKIKDLSAPISTLSGGQRQGIAICRSVLTGPNTILLDEPTAALGITQKEQVRHLLRNLREQGLALMVISHDMQDVQDLADVVIVLRLGQKVAEFRRGEYSKNDLVEAITGAGVGY